MKGKLYPSCFSKGDERPTNSIFDSSRTNYLRMHQGFTTAQRTLIFDSRDIVVSGSTGKECDQAEEQKRNDADDIIRKRH